MSKLEELLGIKIKKKKATLKIKRAKLRENKPKRRFVVGRTKR